MTNIEGKHCCPECGSDNICTIECEVQKFPRLYSRDEVISYSKTMLKDFADLVIKYSDIDEYYIDLWLKELYRKQETT